MNTILLYAIGILSVARTARLLVWDEYPPMVWARDTWDAHVTGGWNKLAHCAFCATPYLAVGMTVWALLALHDSQVGDWWSSAWWWTVINGTWGGSYLAAIVVAYDQPPD